MIKIEKGQYFTDINNQKYIFLGYKNPNVIYCLKEDYEDTGEIFLFDTDIIDNKLDMYNDKVKKMNWYYECEEDFDNTNLTEKLDTLICNLKSDFKNWENEVGYMKLDIRIKKISDLVKATAYHADFNQYYEVIGFIVETETYKGNKKIEENKGLFSIYHSKCDTLLLYDYRNFN